MGWLPHLWHWFEVHTGTVNEGGPYYGFFSGFGSDLGEITLVGGLALGVKHFQCHDTKCHRFGFHHVHGTPFRTCKKHHPTGGNTAAQIRDAYEAAKT